MYMNTQQNASDNDSSVCELLLEKQKLEAILQQLHKQYEETKNEYSNVEQKLLKQCKHVWERDFSDYGEHPVYECSICGVRGGLLQVINIQTLSKYK